MPPQSSRLFDPLLLESLDEPPLILVSSDFEKEFETHLYGFDSIPNVKSEFDPLPAVLEEQLEPEEADPISKRYSFDLLLSHLNVGKDVGPVLDPKAAVEPKGPNANEPPPAA
eukprot:GFUD01032597.1.p2 GENE.GFUD01032597.1~~GFUD01032597.1.p2  ORF type:complete len:113 (-),score=36.09 GFUD01032597.1:35-373(-)